MLTRLTMVMRAKAARIVVALYAFCLVAPVTLVAFAGSAQAHFLPNSAQVQHAGHLSSDATHVHQGMTHAGHDHQASGLIASSGTESAGAESTGAVDDQTGMTHSGGKSITPSCCGVMCVSALPASMFELTPRTMIHASVVASSDAGISGEAPDRLYRPPIVPLSL